MYRFLYKNVLAPLYITLYRYLFRSTYTSNDNAILARYNTIVPFRRATALNRDLFEAIHVNCSKILAFSPDSPVSFPRFHGI